MSQGFRILLLKTVASKKQTASVVVLRFDRFAYACHTGSLGFEEVGVEHSAWDLQLLCGFFQSMGSSRQQLGL